MNDKTSSRLLPNLLINKRFQLWFLSYFVLLFLINAITLYSCIYFFFVKLNLNALSVGIPDQHVFFTFLNQLKADLDSSFLALAIGNLLLLLVVGLFLSHRIAGPLHKLKNYLIHSTYLNGDFKLRKNDFFIELESVVNDLKKKLK